MRRLFAGLAGLALIAGCADSRSGLGPVSGTAFAISEGRFGGNADFFFAAPLATTPQAGDVNYDVGAANQDLTPYVRVCETDGAAGPAGCVRDVTLEVTGSATGALLEPAANGEFYLGPLPTKALQTSRDYRIEVWGIAVSSPTERATLDPRWLFGFRDVRHSATAESCTGTEAFCLITYGVSIPMKVRIEEFAFCPVIRNCAVQFVAANTDAVLEAQLPPGGSAPSAQLFIPAQEGTNFSIAFEPCTPAEDAAVSNSLDLPTFGPCLKTSTTFTGLLNTPAIVSLCDDLDPSSFGLPASQLEQLALHHVSADLSAVDALPEAWQCGSPTAGRVTAREPALSRFASALGSRLRQMVTPRLLHAAPIDRGGGGMTLSVASFFKLALAAKFEYVAASDALRTGFAGTTTTLTARVTDLHGDPVKNARVRWTVASSPAPGASVTSISPVLTDESGLAQATVQLSSAAGMNVFHASGRGIAADGVTECAAPSPSTSSCNGPRHEYDSFLPFHSPEIDDHDHGPEMPVRIAEGTRLPFHVFGCAPGSGTATVDGTFASGEWACARTYDFVANVSGGSTPATLHVMNDGNRLYVALRIRRSVTDRVNRLQLNFDNNNSWSSLGTGVAEAGDDVLSLDALTGLTDGFLPAKCTNSSQSSCWSTDVSDGGTNDGTGAIGNDGEYTTYELSHPLNSTDDARDFSLAGGSRVGMFLTLQTGNGAAGNTQWPSFRRYLEIIIQP